MSILAVDLGGTNIRVGLVQGDQVVARDALEGHSELGLAQALTRLADALKKLRTDEVTGVAVALPTLVDGRTGRVLAQMKRKYEGLIDTDFVAWSQAELGLPICLENDAHAAILGEWRAGAGRGSDNLVMITLGTGIGTSVITSGRALRGPHAQAGNLGGHFVVDPAGFDCVCGGRGCLEAQQHLNAVRSLAHADARWPTNSLSREPLLDYAALFRNAPHDPLARHLLARSLDLWGMMVVSLIHQFDCDRVIVGGGVLRSRDIVIPHLQAFADRACTPWGRAKVVASDLSDDAALLGLASLYDQPPEYL